MERNRTLRRLPSVNDVLAQKDVQPLLLQFPRAVVREGVRRLLEIRRKQLVVDKSRRSGARERLSGAQVSDIIAKWLTPALRPVINATGVVLHTNLGRAPLAPDVVRQVSELAGSYCNLELDLASGQRGSRMDVVREILLERTGAEDALVVNNNAAAVYLALRALALGREVVVSRGELVEIGGTFRIPDVMHASGAKLVEVGTTNKTRLADYEHAIGADTALILVVQRSNFAMVGFVEQASIEELSALSRSRGIPLMLDMGSGILLDRPPVDWGEVQTVRGILTSGVGLVCFSGDKLLGGPQSGILLGRRALIERLARDPMARALRVGKLTLAALGATLSLFRGGDSEAQRVPVVGMLLAEPADLKRRAKLLLDAIRRAGVAADVELVSCEGQVGGGAMPLVTLAGHAVALKPRAGSARSLAERLRTGRPAVLARVHQDRIILDVRTVLDQQELLALADAVRRSAVTP